MVEINTSDGKSLHDSFKRREKSDDGSLEKAWRIILEGAKGRTMPSRKFELDQHFLKSPKFALMLIGHSNIRKNDTVVEIGAGSGVITTALSKKCKVVYALEPDKETAEKLRKNLNVLAPKMYVVIEKDFQDVEFPKEPYKVFANPPFRFSSEIFYKVGLRSENGRRQNCCKREYNTLPEIDLFDSPEELRS